MNSSSLITIFIFATVISLGCLTSPGAATCHPDDEAALLAFKSGITRDPVGILSSWKKGTDCCMYWSGVNCNTGDRVTDLYVSGGDTPNGRGYLYGTISPSLAKLQHLEDFAFTSLRLTGSFPQFLFQLPKLHMVRIKDTRLSGPLPANIGALSNLEELTIDNNRFTGQIPSSTSNLTRLAWLNIRGLSGPIPDIFKSMTELFGLDLSGNGFSGDIPDIFKPMKKLKYLDLSNNGFSGKLPPSVESLASTLIELNLSQNNLSGTIPSYLSRFKALSTLDLSRNQYTGAVPMSFANLKALSKLSLSHNLLTDPFPALKFGHGISILDLSYNIFHLKTLPRWVTTSPYIDSLKLAKCGIKMSLDDWTPRKIESFTYIDLSENEISGSAERFLNKAKYLEEFLASGNKLRFDLGKLNITKSLRNLDLSRNLVFGPVPASVARVKKLNLSQNHLCGKLPVTKFPVNVFAGNDCLCGSPLPPCKA